MILLIACLFNFTGVSLRAAEVAPLTGALTEVSHDFGKPSDGPMGLERYYTSKTDTSGLFGLGWGTIYEARLVLEKDGGVTIHELGHGRANRFVRRSTGLVSVLFPGDQLISDIDGFRWAHEDGTNFFFTPGGRLKRVLEGGGGNTAANLVYDTQGRLAGLKDDAGNQVHFIRAKSNFIETVKGLRGAQLTYRYDATGKLISAKDATGQGYQYEYGAARKLTLIAATNGAKTRIAYYGAEGGFKVQSFSPINGSTVEYRYALKSASPRRYTTLLSLRDARGDAIASGSYEYEMKVEPTGDEWPQKILATIDGRRTEKSYVKCCGNEPVAFDLETLIRQTWLDAVVRVHVNSGGNHYVGSGFFVSPGGGLITNYHVMQHLTTDPNAEVEFEFADGRIVKDFLVGECKESVMLDLCFLKLNFEPKRFFEPREDSPPKGAPVYHIGNPGGERFLLGVGQFIGDYALDNAGYVEVSNPIHPGDSGGPIFTFRGRLVGVSTLIHTKIGEYQTLETGDKHYVGMSSKEVVKIRLRAPKFQTRNEYFN